MSSGFNFTVTSWFLGNVRVNPYFNTQCPPVPTALTFFQGLVVVSIQRSFSWFMNFSRTYRYINHVSNNIVRWWFCKMFLPKENINLYFIIYQSAGFVNKALRCTKYIQDQVSWRILGLTKMLYIVSFLHYFDPSTIVPRWKRNFFFRLIRQQFDNMTKRIGLTGVIFQFGPR